MSLKTITILIAGQTYIYILILLGAAFLSWLLNIALLKRSARLGVRDLSNTDIIRWNNVTKPSIGGISFFATFLVGFVGLALFGGTSVLSLMGSTPILGLFAATSLAFLIGLTDDIYTLNPFIKFSGQLICANILYFSGIFIDISYLVEINYVISLFWVVGMMNAINMLDNMDGITGITSVGIILATMVVMFVSGAFSLPYFVLMTVVLGSLLGFLKLNFNPAKVYMGDSGSQFLGAFLSGIGMLYLWNIYQTPSTQLIRWSQFALPLVVFILPIIDTLTVSIRRISRGQSPFVGGRDHTTHNLAVWGLTDKQVGFTFAFVGLISVTFALWTFQHIVNQPIICTLLAGIYFLLLFWGIQLVYQININRERLIERQTVVKVEAKVKQMRPALQSIDNKAKVKDKSLV